MSDSTISDALKSIDETLSDFRLDCAGFGHRAEALTDELECLRDQLLCGAHRLQQQQLTAARCDAEQTKQLRQHLEEVQNERDFLRSQLDRSLQEISKLNEELCAWRERSAADARSNPPINGAYHLESPIETLEQLESLELSTRKC